MIHVISGAGDASVIIAALPDKFEEIIDAGENVVHENNGIEILVLCVA